MKTTIILHVILMTVAMNGNMRFSNGIPLDPDAEEKFFTEFIGVCDDERKLNQISSLLHFSVEEEILLKQHTLRGQFAHEITNHVRDPVLCRPVLDKLARDDQSILMRVEKLCVITIMYGEQTIGYRKSLHYPNRIYAFVYNSDWRHINPFLHVYPPLKVLDLVDISLVGRAK